MREWENSPEEELDEMQASNLSDRELRVVITRIPNSMRKDIKTIKNDQPGMKNAISEINNTLEGINNRLDEAEDQISDLEDMVEKSSVEQKMNNHNNNAKQIAAKDLT